MSVAKLGYNLLQSYRSSLMTSIFTSTPPLGAQMCVRAFFLVVGPVIIILVSLPAATQDRFDYLPDNLRPLMRVTWQDRYCADATDPYLPGFEEHLVCLLLTEIAWACRPSETVEVCRERSNAWGAIDPLKAELKAVKELAQRRAQAIRHWEGRALRCEADLQNVTN